MACYMMGRLIGALVWFGTWDIGGLSGNGEACEELIKWMADVHCLHEVRWRRQGSTMMGME